MNTRKLIQDFFNVIVLGFTFPIYFWMTVYQVGTVIVNDIIRKIWLFLETGSMGPQIFYNYESPSHAANPQLPPGTSPAIKPSKST